MSTIRSKITIQRADYPVYKRHIWTDEQVKIFWNYESRFPENYWSRNFGKDLIKNYSRYLIDAKIILDLGCGDGGFIDLSYLLNDSAGL